MYFWDLDDGFAGVVLLKKSLPFHVEGPMTISANIGQQLRPKAKAKEAGTPFMCLKLSTGHGEHTTSSRVRSFCIWAPTMKALATWTSVAI